MRPNRALVGLMSVLGVSLACAGPADITGPVTAPVPVEAPSAPAEHRGPPVLGAITVFELDGAGCSCSAPSGIGSSYLSGGDSTVMAIDGVERHLTMVSQGNQGQNRRERLAADGYIVDMQWKELSQVEGGATYDVKVVITHEDRPPFKATLSCGCGC